MQTTPSTRVKHIWTESAALQSSDKRTGARLAVKLPGRLTWKDTRGATRFLSVTTRNVSDFGVYVECQTPVTIPLYRLVQFQLEQEGPEADRLPAALRQGRLLSAVYRVAPPNLEGGRQGFALRLMIDPKRVPAAIPAPARATA